MAKPPATDPEDGNLPSELQAVFGANMRRTRSAAGLSQTALAAAAGIAQQDVSDIERGLINLTLQRMDRIAKALGTTASALLQVSGNDDPPT